LTAEVTRAKGEEKILRDAISNETSISRSKEALLQQGMDNMTVCSMIGKLYVGAGFLGADAKGCVSASSGPGGSPSSSGVDCLDLRKQGVTISGKYWVEIFIFLCVIVCE